ncbi:rhoGEF domain-containing protein gxcJ isoform X2 [Planococcus citri]|uniref:rhoGEF domain-containing protein gxcJ isoform X2 n=1 Tax=Planococcus citri TaxID=170843 RepID=UPI0031F73B15
MMGSGSSNSEDLLPCLLNVYDSIAAARKLTGGVSGSTRIASEKEKMTENDTLIEPSARLKEAADSNGAKLTSSSRSWYNYQSLTSPSSLRPKSAISVASMSSSTSLSSSRSSNSSNNSSVNPDNERPDQRTVQNNSSSTTNLTDKSLDSLVEIQPHANRTKAIADTQPRTSYATSSQYSEDSGIYSNFMRSESLHERSWFCNDSEDFNYTSRVVAEILETELAYVDDLHQIITGYLDEWRNDCNCALSSEQINDLFGNIEEIYHFNRCFLWELEQCGQDPVKIAGSFVENNCNFSIYAAYCTHYPRSMNILTELMRQEKTAHIFRERQISLHHTLPLGSYLLKPVQRILKYHLLLQNMVKHTPPDTVGYNDITVALSTMTGIAHHINTMKRRHEHAIRVQEVQSLLTGWQGPDLITFGELYAEGSFRISGAKALRHVFLFEHMLLVTKKKEGGILNYKTHILCSNLMLVECVPKELLSFQIIPFDSPRMQFTVHARSLEEKRHWTLELKRVILENYNVDIPSHARQLVMELGQIQQTDDIGGEKISTKRHHSTPDYLQRRKVDKGKKTKIKSRLLPLFRKSDILLNNKMRSKLKKNQFLSEGSIFSDTSANSDESYGNDSSLLNLSKTTTPTTTTTPTSTPTKDSASHRLDRLTRQTLENISKLSCSSSNNSVDGTGRNSSISSGSNTTPTNFSSRDDLDRSCSSSCVGTESELDDSASSSYQQKEKLIEEIIGQLLIASQKFQRAIKDHQQSVKKTKKLAESVSCEETEEEDDDADLTEDDDEDRDYRLKYTKESNRRRRTSAEVLNTSSESLSASLRQLIPTSPNIWLKQQSEHLATPQKKADSLPRTWFQGTPSEADEWRINRPKTIASDKPTRMKEAKAFDTEDMTNTCFLAGRNRRTEIATSLMSLNTANVHPECKFYRTSVARMTFRSMVQSMGLKLLSKRGKNERRSYTIEHEIPKPKCTFTSTIDKELIPTYKQGSSDLGARIAHGKEIPDYADPKVLFPTITPSKKAASLLGIRAYPNESTKLDEKPIGKGGDGDSKAAQKVFSKKIDDKEADSDDSAESFYERKFEQVESEFENAIRETSILADAVNAERAQEISDSFKKYSQINVNISRHKAIRIPPPVPLKPTALRNRMAKAEGPSKESRIGIPSPECTIPTRGWVKHVVERFQNAD